ncbi:uncharacterized protein A1O9_02827 [Exophiala aquamarina CBS 119918]|uniref:Beta-lactamase-related domain-containing protein n=1 Tax=Exophiala aquamarina CBS 119918 TaxID=1182545 RepID=A0A072PNH6_9EURO|nr:uncharacterized protein A1O9_02827 [Exophiala aquamarina CBS 119918]KEF61262.1 hypothetical protein A1O9_02827 [Exophiala aquamarina CBS 119918]
MPSDHFLCSDRFSSLVGQLMIQHHVPGLSIATVQDQKIRSVGYGHACLTRSTPCTADTLFDIASSAKSLTAAAVGLLVVDNQSYPEVQWDATMSSLLPNDFVMSGTGYTEGVTVEDILSHRSGMAAHDSSYMGHRAVRPDNAQSITRNLRNLPVAAPIRARYLYCNMMYTVATYLVEVKSTQSFGQFLQHRIFQPLGMQSTSLQPGSARSKVLGDRIASGYYWQKAESTYYEVQSSDCEEGQGAGSIISSVGDFIKWIKALLNRENPISERLYQGLVRGRSLKNPNARRLKPYSSPAIYAAGLEVHYYRGCMVVGHDGNIAGFASRFLFLPDFKFGAVIFANSSNAGPVTSILAREFMDHILQVPEIERPRHKFKTTANTPTTAKPLVVASDFYHSPNHQGTETHKNTAKNQSQARKKNKVQQKSDHPGGVVQTQKTPLEAYTGVYSHPGYHALVVQIKDGNIFIDATDRSMGFTLTFEHVSDQTKYIAHLSDLVEGGDDPIKAEFILEGAQAVKMGLNLEPALMELIWFEKHEVRRG